MTADTARATALNRFGLGARPGDFARAGDPVPHLMDQLQRRARTAAFDGLPSSAVYLRKEAEALQMIRAQRRQAHDNPQGTDPKAMGLRREYQLVVRQELDARYRNAVDTPDGFAERLVRFWSNHFAVSADKRQARLYAAPMEREAIRPNAFGRFSDLLLAVERHPAMLRYLDNVRSVGADSKLAQRAMGKRPLGLNENLAREILELHTLGVDGGYSQADVTELARAITGWSTPLPRDFESGRADGAFVFREAAHEGGERRVLSRRYAEDGLAQGNAVLRDVAMHPATARHVSLKLARHFVADAPPPALVERMAQAWLRSGGALADVYRVLVESPESWAPDARKFKSPDDFIVSALRAVGGTADVNRLQPVLAQLGQPAFTPRSPAGFPDTTAAWGGGDALYKRVQAAQRLAELADGTPDPNIVARNSLGPRLDADTATVVRRAESARSGLALFLASPAFQWRT